jgi:putative alpha-1,2-mannosidase
MHDYDQMQIMPQLGDSVVDVTTEGRRIAYHHDNEIAQPDYYSVVFENGIKTELTPSSHSVIMRFTFPNQNGRIIFDSLLRSSRCSDQFVFQNNILSGYVDNGA